MLFPASRFSLLLLVSTVGTLVFTVVYLVGGSVTTGTVLAFGFVLITRLGQPGIEFNNNRSAYRNYFTFLGWRLGWWQSLPQIVGVTLKYYTSLSGSDRTPSGTTSWGVWNKQSHRSENLILLLSVPRSTTGLIVYYYELDDVNTAIDTAQEMADFFRVPMHRFLPPHLFPPAVSE